VVDENMIIAAILSPSRGGFLLASIPIAKNDPGDSSSSFQKESISIHPSWADFYSFHLTR